MCTNFNGGKQLEHCKVLGLRGSPHPREVHGTPHIRLQEREGPPEAVTRAALTVFLKVGGKKPASLDRACSCHGNCLLKLAEHPQPRKGTETPAAKPGKAQKFRDCNRTQSCFFLKTNMTPRLDCHSLGKERNKKAKQILFCLSQHYRAAHFFPQKKTILKKLKMGLVLVLVSGS